MSLSRLLFILLAVVTLSGCYSKDFQEPGVRSVDHFNTERTVRASYNASWTAVTSVLKDVSLVTARKENGYLMTDWIVGKSDRLYSGYDSTKIPLKIRYRMSVTLRPYKDGSTSIKVTNEEQYWSDAISAGTDFTGSLYQWIDTPSSTQKERNLLDSIESFLAKNPTAAN